MNEEWQRYFAQFGIARYSLESPVAIMQICESTHGAIEEIFISEPEERVDRQRQCASLWLFSKTWALEAKWSGEDWNWQISCTSLKRVDHYTLDTLAYDLQEANRESRMTLVFYNNGIAAGTLIAYGSNCERLGGILANYIAPRVCDYVQLKHT